jgi:hypothetical protein
MNEQEISLKKIDEMLEIENSIRTLKNKLMVLSDEVDKGEIGRELYNSFIRVIFNELSSVKTRCTKKVIEEYESNPFE